MVFESGGEMSREKKSCKNTKKKKVQVLNTAEVRLYVGTWHSQVPDEKQCERQSTSRFYAQNQMFGVEHQHEHIVVSKRSRSIIETLACPARFPYMQATQARYVWANARACQCVRKVASSFR